MFRSGVQFGSPFRMPETAKYRIKLEHLLVIISNKIMSYLCKNTDSYLS
jgi:hypothetical protein